MHNQPIMNNQPNQGGPTWRVIGYRTGEVVLTNGLSSWIVPTDLNHWEWLQSVQGKQSVTGDDVIEVFRQLKSNSQKVLKTLTKNVTRDIVDKPIILGNQLKGDRING